MMREILAAPLRPLGRWLFGADLRALAAALRRLDEQEGQTQRLSEQVARQQQLLDILLTNPHAAWLYRNGAERMDATVGLFDPLRRAFHLGRYRFAAEHVRGRAVADIACGTGYGSELLRTAGGAARVVGVDIDAEAVAYARAAHAPDGVEFACAPGERTGLPDASVEVVVSFETIEHVPSDRALLAEFARVLRPGGVLVCSTPNRWPLAITPHHVREYDRAGFAAALGEWFGDIRMYNQNSGSNWPYNHGQPAGICPTTPDNEELAECFIAVARKAGGGDQPGAPQ